MYKVTCAKGILEGDSVMPLWKKLVIFVVMPYFSYSCFISQRGKLSPGRLSDSSTSLGQGISILLLQIPVGECGGREKTEGDRSSFISS